MAASDDDDRPKKKIVHEIGQDLSLLSTSELAERIAALGHLRDGEVARAVAHESLDAGERARHRARRHAPAARLHPRVVVARHLPHLSALAAQEDLRDLEPPDAHRARAEADEEIHRAERLPSGRFIAYLPGPHVGIGRLRLVTGDHRAYATEIIEALEHMIGDEPDARVMLVGSAQGGVAAAQIAADTAGEPFIVEQVVTAGSPSSQVPRIPEETQVLSLEDRADPVALLGSLINAGVDNRLTVVFDGADAPDGVYVTGGRIVDRSGHPELRAAVGRLRRLGYLA